MPKESLSLRAFIALLPPPRFLDAADQLLTALKKEAPWQNILWHRLSNLHITLHHLGQIALNDLNLMQAIKTICAQTAPFQVDFDGLCYFPQKQPKVLALKVSDNTALQNFALQLQTELHSTKIQFQGHITLGRLSAHFTDYPVLPPLESLPSFSVKSCFVLESRRQDQQSVYIPLAKFALMP